MLAYAFRVLNKESYENVATEKFEHTADLLATIIIKGINNQIKRGLGKEYVQTTSTLNSPKGKINMAQSFMQQSRASKQLICSYDTYTEDFYMNQILKTTMLLLLKTTEVSKKNKKDLNRILIHFKNVEQISYKSIQWSALKYHRNNQTYQMLMNVCYLIIEGLLLSEQKGSYKLATFIDDQQMHKLFEKFVLEYYRKHHPEFKASSPHVQWKNVTGEIEFLPTMKTDIVLKHNDKKLIIDTKFYSKTMQKNYDVSSFHSHNLYQILAYIKNEDKLNTGNVIGVLLYAKTEEDITPNSTFTLDGNLIGVKTVDLNTEFQNIMQELDNLANEFFN